MDAGTGAASSPPLRGPGVFQVCFPCRACAYACDSCCKPEASGARVVPHVAHISARTVGRPRWSTLCDKKVPSGSLPLRPLLQARSAVGPSPEILETHEHRSGVHRGRRRRGGRADAASQGVGEPAQARPARRSHVRRRRHLPAWCQSPVLQLPGGFLSREWPPPPPPPVAPSRARAQRRPLRWHALKAPEHMRRDADHGFSSETLLPTERPQW